MSSSTNEALQQELDRMKDIIGQYQQQETETAELLLRKDTLNTADLQQRVDDLERENVLRSPLSPSSPSTEPPTCHDVSGAIGRNNGTTNDR